MKNLIRLHLSISGKRINYFLGIIILMIFSGCAANSPDKTSQVDGVSTPSAYYSKLDEVPSNENWIKEISKDKDLENIILSLIHI